MSEPVSLKTILERDKIALNRKRARRALRTRKGPNYQRLLVSEKQEPGFLDALRKVLG